MPEVGFFVQTYDTATHLKEYIDNMVAQRGDYLTENWSFCYVDEGLADHRVHAIDMHHMHHHMIGDRTGETTSFQVLNWVFGNVPRQEEKRRA
jgi:hypothetical protein